MKYVAIIDSEDELSEKSIEKIKDTLFVGNKAKYCFEIKSIKQAPESTTKNNLSVDCIDREQAQTEIELNACRYTLAQESGCMGNVEWSDSLIKVSDAVDIIRNLPSVTPTTKWIPASEKLPKKGEQVLCCNNKSSVFTSALTYVSDGGYAYFGQHFDVIAWRPLPEPYKTESEIN